LGSVLSTTSSPTEAHRVTRGRSFATEANRLQSQQRLPLRRCSTGADAPTNGESAQDPQAEIIEFLEYLGSWDGQEDTVAAVSRRFR
jgi:hypothetical protein